ncbi:TPA: hypothetical protein QFF41_001449 [Enterococcus faecium]|uniref:hypothetical protein n=1 Tax=Bacteria TaxID=2 RepID=UPI00115A0438|nr:hypothetical protein [Enterococcus faecium]
MASVLNEPVYRVKEYSNLNRLYAETEQQREVLDVSMKQIFVEFPCFNGGVLGMWTTTRMGIEIGSQAEIEFESELKKEESQGYRIFKKKSPTLKLLNDLIGDSLEAFNTARANYKFELHTQYGINNVSGTHFIDGQLYVGLRKEPEENSDELEPIDYKEYLSLYINSQQQEEK